MQGCKALTSPVPLKQGERHCVYCAGYGAHPIMFDPHFSQFDPRSCGHCLGMGKDRSTLHPDTYVNPEYAA